VGAHPARLKQFSLRATIAKNQRSAARCATRGRGAHPRATRRCSGQRFCGRQDIVVGASAGGDPQRSLIGIQSPPLGQAAPGHGGPNQDEKIDRIIYP